MLFTIWDVVFDLRLKNNEEFFTGVIFKYIKEVVYKDVLYVNKLENKLLVKKKRVHIKIEDVPKNLSGLHENKFFLE